MVNSTSRKPSAGFTLVELLIVIVVIAILAAISVVAYNGIQSRAHSTAASLALDTYVKSLKLYKIDNGSYPVITSGPSTVCLGTVAGYPAQGVFTAGQCVQSDFGLSYAVSETISSELSEYISDHPEMSWPPTPEVIDGFGSANYRGIMYSSLSNGASANIWYIFRGNYQCPGAATTSTYYASYGYTRCQATLS